MSQDLSEPGLIKILVVDDHEIILSGTIEPLRQQYPEAKILTAKTAHSVLNQVEEFPPDLVVLDLSIPETLGDTPQIDMGINALRILIKNHSNLNVVVLSSHAKALVRIKHEIDEHQGGFTVADKTSIEDLLKKVDWALEGLTNTKNVKELRTGELKPEWYEVLNLGVQGLTDKEIAKHLNIVERTVWNYWGKIRDVFEIYPEDGKNLRVQTLMKARELGFID